MLVRLFFVLCAFAISSPANAKFIGTLAFKPAGCQAAGECKLVYDFGFIDPRGVGWQAKAGLKTDGASIPSWAQAIIGGPWENGFIKAAVIHDWYCIRTVRTRSSTHRMFFDALIESGVSRSKSLIMYYGVTVGSHMWINLMEGQNCKGVANCIQSVGAALPIPDAIVRKSENGELQAYRAPRFDQPEIAKDIAEAAVIIEGGSIDTPEEVEAMALNRHPDDFFLQHGDAVVYEGPSSSYPDR